MPNQAATAGARSRGRELQQLAVPSCTHLALLQDVPQQREVLCCEVPERLHTAAVNEGYQVEVLELWRGRNRGERCLQQKAGGGSSTVQSFLGCAVMCTHTYLLTSFTNLQARWILAPNPSNVSSNTSEAPVQVHSTLNLPHRAAEVQHLPRQQGTELQC